MAEGRGRHRGTPGIRHGVTAIRRRTNYRFLAHAVWSTGETVDRMF